MEKKKKKLTRKPIRKIETSELVDVKGAYSDACGCSPASSLESSTVSQIT